MIFGFNNKKCYYCGKKIGEVHWYYELIPFCSIDCTELYKKDIAIIRNATKEITDTLKKNKNKDFIIITTKKLATELMEKINDRKMLKS